jgi:hypothetical protein
MMLKIGGAEINTASKAPWPLAPDRYAVQFDQKSEH